MVKYNSLNTLSQKNPFDVIVSQADGIATTEGLHDVLAGERVKIGAGVEGMVFNIEKQHSKAAIFGNDQAFRQDGSVRHTNNSIAQPRLFGRIAGALGKIDRLLQYRKRSRYLSTINSTGRGMLPLVTGIVYDDKNNSQRLTFPDSWNTAPPVPTTADTLKDLLFNLAYFPEIPIFGLAVLAIICTPVIIVRGYRRTIRPLTALTKAIDKLNSFNLVILSAYIVVVLLIFTYAVGLHAVGEYHTIPRVYVWYHHLRVDNFVFHIKAIILLLGLGTLITINIFERGRQRSNQWKFLLILLAVPNLLLIVSSNHLLTAFVFVEIVSMISYALVAITRTAEPDRVAQTALTYFAQGSVASAILLLGVVGCIYGTGQWDFDYISAILGIENQIHSVQRLSIFLVLFGLLFKIGVIPGHLWVQRVYADISDPVLLFFTTAVKFSFLILFFRIYISFVPLLQNHYSFVILAIASTSLIAGLIGGISAIGAQNWRDFIAFTSINQVGYVLAGITFFDSDDLIGAAMYYLFTYILSNFVFVASLAHLQKTLYPSDLRYNRLVPSEEIKYVSRKERLDMWWAVGAASLSAWSIAGLPPLAGFFGKAVLLKKISEVARQSYIYAKNPDLVPQFWYDCNANFANLAGTSTLILILLVIISIASFYYYFKVLEWIHTALREERHWWSNYSMRDKIADIGVGERGRTDLANRSTLRLFQQSQRRSIWAIGFSVTFIVLWLLFVIDQGDIFAVPVLFQIPYPLAP